MRKFIALILTIVLLSFQALPCSAQIYTEGSVELGFQDFATLSFFKTLAEYPEGQALLIASVAQRLQKYDEKLFQLDTSSSAFIDIHPAYIVVFYKMQYYGSYIRVSINESGVYYYTIVPADVQTAKDAFLAIGEPYTTSDQMSAYLDTQTDSYYTVGSEYLSVVQTSLSEKE